ncbi:retrovirus-related pol polyprotein from transposon RE2 [Tanacetum coccineum]
MCFCRVSVWAKRLEIIRLRKVGIFVSRDVVFLEHIFSYYTEPIVPSVNDTEYNDTEIHEEPPSQDRGNELMNEDTMVHENQIVRDDDTLSSPQSLFIEEQIQEENLGRRHRKKETSVRLCDCVTNTFKKMSPSRSTPPAQSRSPGTPYPIAHSVNCDKFSSCHRTFLEAIETEREPVTYYEEIKDKRWRSAMNGLNKGKHGEACKLQKSLYGLRQAPRCWFSKLSSALKNYGFVQSYSDYSLFTLRYNEVQLNVLVYVDDLIISVNESKAITQFKTYLSDCFHMKDLAGLLGAKPAKIPMEQNHRLGLAKGRLFEDPKQYRRLVGRLIYLCFTRPDLVYSVHILSQFMQNPQIEH